MPGPVDPVPRAVARDELPAEAVELALLRLQIPGRWFRGLGLQGIVHALVPAVLLGFAGFDEVRQYPEPHPPGRKTRKPGERVGRERHTVVGTNPGGQTELLEQAREHRLRLFHRRGGNQQ